MTLTLRLPPELAARLEAKAKELGVSRSALARSAVEQAVNGEPQPLSFTDVAREFCGCVLGPPGLSTNPAYMEGSGEDQPCGVPSWTLVHSSRT